MSTSDDLGSDLLASVARLNRWATRHAGVSTPIAGLRLLATLDDQGPSRIGDLARADNCSQPTVTSQVQRLEEAGWVAKTTDPRDARAVRVSITPAGRATLADARALRAATLAPRLGRLTAGQRAALRAAVDVIDAILTDDTSADAG